MPRIFSAKPLDIVRYRKSNGKWVPAFVRSGTSTSLNITILGSRQQINAVPRCSIKSSTQCWGLAPITISPIDVTLLYPVVDVFPSTSIYPR